MLPAQNRLKRDEDFRKVANEGRYAYSSLLTIKYRPNKSAVSRFGFVISTKVDKKSTARNRIKRQMREVIRLRLAKITTGWDFMIIAKKAAIGKNYKELECDLISVLQKTRLYVEDH